jgi:antitoxin VapB
MTAKAKLLRKGRTQTIRLPKGFRFDGDEVCLKRIGAAVLVYPKDKAWELMAEAVGRVDQDFLTPRDQPTRIDQRKHH